MNTIYQNKSNTNSSTFNMEHISDVVLVATTPKSTRNLRENAMGIQKPLFVVVETDGESHERSHEALGTIKVNKRRRSQSQARNFLSH